MLNESDKELIRQTFEEILQASFEEIKRRRVNRSQVPASFDDEFGEVENEVEVVYDEVTIQAKVFRSTSVSALTGGEEFIMDPAGGDVENTVVVYVPFNADVELGDELLIDESWYRVRKKIVPPLKGFKAFIVEKE